MPIEKLMASGCDETETIYYKPGFNVSICYTERCSCIIILFIAFRRKVEALSKEKECEVIGEWVKSMVNHLYWSAVSTPSRNGEKIQGKWLSLDNHIHNIHRGHSAAFPKCEHPRLRGHAKKKKWIKPRKFSKFLCMN